MTKVDFLIPWATFLTAIKNKVWFSHLVPVFLTMLKSRIVFQSLVKRKFHALPGFEKFVITPEIKAAILKQGPVVALESTIISHGKRRKKKHDEDTVFVANRKYRYAISSECRDSKSCRKYYS